MLGSFPHPLPFQSLPLLTPQDPAQLLEVFSQLEASNMFQIAAAQEAEAALEAARSAHATMQVGGLCMFMCLEQGLGTARLAAHVQGTQRGLVTWPGMQCTQ